MRISSRGEYGVRALFDLALHYGQGPVALKTVAERQAISEHYLEQLMGALRKAGLVHSVRGAQGGYELALPPAQIRVGDIIRALEGRIGPALAQPRSRRPAGARGLGIGQVEHQAIERLWRQLTEEINRVLDATTLEDLRREAEALRAQQGAYMYHI
ncbi:MAG TPA: Rrf2 family transcriptional regulator [Limnochordia bacterium]